MENVEPLMVRAVEKEGRVFDAEVSELRQFKG